MEENLSKLHSIMHAAETKCLETIFSQATADASISRRYCTTQVLLFVYFSWPLN